MANKTTTFTLSAEKRKTEKNGPSNVEVKEPEPSEKHFRKV